MHPSPIECVMRATCCGRGTWDKGFGDNVIRELDPRIPISEVRSMNEVVQQAIAAPRFAMQLLGLFGILALVLSAIGIFGIVSQVVASRTQELGIRAALGGTPRNLLMLSVMTG